LGFAFAIHCRDGGGQSIKANTIACVKESSEVLLDDKPQKKACLGINFIVIHGAKAYVESSIGIHNPAKPIRCITQERAMVDS
jgi:hypothetical protein